jgi:hypothetical protein
MITLKNKLASIIVASLGFGGCEYRVSQQGVDFIVEDKINQWKEYTDNTMNAQELLEEGKYDEAKAVLDAYLKQQQKEGEEYADKLKQADKISQPAAKRIEKTIDSQLQRINKHTK